MPRQVSVNWGGKERSVTVHEPLTVNRNERIQNPELKAEAELLPQVAALADAGLAIFQISIETQVEIGGIPDLDSETGYFYRADRQIAAAPVRYSRVLFGGIQDWWEGQYTFLSSLKHERFLQLQRITGAYQGLDKNVNRNQRSIYGVRSTTDPIFFSVLTSSWPRSSRKQRANH
jgi:hypothetical protein